MHGVGGQGPRTEGRPEYKTETAEEVIGGQEQEMPDDKDIFLFYFLTEVNARESATPANSA
jgi:hypothetical protein